MDRSFAGSVGAAAGAGAEAGQGWARVGQGWAQRDFDRRETLSPHVIQGWPYSDSPCVHQAQGHSI